MRRLQYVFAAIAAVAGVLAIFVGTMLYYNLDLTEVALKKGGYFSNPEYGNVSYESWRSGYFQSIIGLIGAGAFGLVAAIGLFLRRRWGQLAWFVTLAVLVLVAAPDLPHDMKAWIWLLVCVGLAASSWVVFRRASEPRS